VTISSAVAMCMKKMTLLPRQTDKQPRHPRLSDRQHDVLDSLAVFGDWARPMDIGARDGSHHSATLSGLASHGLVDRKKIHAIYCYNGSRQRQKLVDNRWIITDGHPPSTGCCCKGSCRYRITPAGREALGPDRRRKMANPRAHPYHRAKASQP
jgi:hypothetical protein